MGNRKNWYKGKRRIQTNKLIDRLFYEPDRGKKRAQRQELQNRNCGVPTTEVESHPELKFGSFNIRGLDHETYWYVEQLLKDRQFDVSGVETLGKGIKY